MKINRSNLVKRLLKITFFSALFISIGFYVYKEAVPTFATTLTWTSTSIPATGTYRQVVASSADGKRLIVAGNSTYIYTSSDSGATWVARTSAGQRYWSDVTSSADGMKLAAADSNSGGYVYTSSDGGVTWTARTGVSGNWTRLASSADGTKLAVAGIGTYLYISTDSGATWNVTGANSGGGYVTGGGMVGSLFWSGITMSADGTKIAAISNNYYGYVYTSADSGTTWRTSAQILAPNGGLFGITSSADGTKLAVTSYDGQIYTSADGGMTWVTRTPPLEPGVSVNHWGGISTSADGTKLAAVGQNSYIYTSSDSGITWNSNTYSTQIGAMAKGKQYNVAYSSDGSTIVVPFVGGQGTIYIGKDRNTNCDWVGYNPPVLTITSPYPGQVFTAGSSFRIQGSVKYHMTTASAENVTIGWSNYDGSQKGSQTLYSTSSSCSINGCPNSDNTSNFSLTGFATSAPAIIASTTPGTYRFYVYATSTNSCTTDVMSGYQDYVVSQAGQCGTKNTNPVTQFDKNHPVAGTDCSAGSIINQSQTGSTHNWQCSGINGGATSAQCSYIYNNPVDGVCGPDTGVATNTTPVNLCYVGTSTSPTLSSSGYAWTCQGSNYGAPAPCTAPFLPNISVASFKLISSLANTASNQCTATWSVDTTGSSTVACTINGQSVSPFSAGYQVSAGTQTLTCKQGSASFSKSVKCRSNPGYREI